jgi:Zn ribbon nucleic-acid-binding protein
MNRTGSKPKVCEHGNLGASKCTECRRKWSSKYYQTNRKACIAYTEAKHAERRNKLKDWIADTKQKVGCIKCGFSNPVALQFHHRDPSSKVFSIGNFVRRWHSVEEIAAEMDKCDVICANCHLILHHEKRHSKSK